MSRSPRLLLALASLAVLGWIPGAEAGPVEQEAGEQLERAGSPAAEAGESDPEVGSGSEQPRLPEQDLTPAQDQGPPAQPPVEPVEPPQATAQARTSRLQGTAFLDRRNKVVGASVVVRPESDSSRLYLTSTDAKGRFRIDGLADGSYRVLVRRDGLQPVTKEQVSLKFPFRAVVEIAMQPGSSEAGSDRLLPANGSGAATVRGRVVDLAGSPLSEVAIRMVHADGHADPRSARSDLDGRFEVRDLLSGDWRVTVRGLGYLSIRADLGLSEQTETTVVLIPQPAGYDPSPLDLLPDERPIPPADLNLGLTPPDAEATTEEDTPDEPSSGEESPG